MCRIGTRSWNHRVPVDSKRAKLGTSIGAAAVGVITCAAITEWKRLEALDRKADEAPPALANDAPLAFLAMESAFAGYCSCRQRGDEPDIDSSTMAATAAFLIVRMSLARHPHPLQLERALQTIKDCHARFPRGIECGQIYRHCVDRAIDFGAVRDIV